MRARAAACTSARLLRSSGDTGRTCCCSRRRRSFWRASIAARSSAVGLEAWARLTARPAAPPIDSRTGGDGGTGGISGAGTVAGGSTGAGAAPARPVSTGFAPEGFRGVGSVGSIGVTAGVTTASGGAAGAATAAGAASFASFGGCCFASISAKEAISEPPSWMRESGGPPPAFGGHPSDVPSSPSSSDWRLY